MSQESIQNPEYNIHNHLKQKLLSGEISPDEFRNKLIELDQSTDDRNAAIPNLELLNDPEVIEYVKDQSEEIQKGYYQTLSFTELHVAQIKALDEVDYEGSLSHLENSLEHEYRAHAFPQNIAYKKATIAYFKKDIQALKEAIKKDIEGNNLKIVQSLLKGLEERGYPNYKEDYKIN